MRRAADGVLECEADEYAHGGDLGDIIHGLCAIKAMTRGQARVTLFPWPGRTTHLMTRERAGLILPLLETQPYICKARWRAEEVRSNWNGFRDHAHWWRTLGGCHLGTYGLNSHRHVREPWLWAAPERRAPIVVHRSARYRTSTFPWRRLAAEWGDDMVALGLPEEVRDLERVCGRELAHAETRDLLEAAEVIRGADLFIGNQSSPFALAEAMKRPALLEGCRHANNCNYGRRTCRVLYEDDSLRAGDVELLMGGQEFRTVQIYGPPRSGTNLMEWWVDRVPEWSAISYGLEDKHTHAPRRVADAHVVVLKNPAAWLRSLARMGWKAPDPTDQLRGWVGQVRASVDFAADPANRAEVVLYERLLEDPAAAWGTISELVGGVQVPMPRLPVGVMDRDGHPQGPRWDPTYYLEGRYWRELTRADRRALMREVPRELWALWEIDAGAKLKAA